ncbi:MAG TPA: endolytic transglycosylase MltG [Candidatus Sumerlaeota bacterium]|nr:endolytic transglycosylase MltG [Candidatus Sumerlaeota bacterium]HPS02755.1 endolytic transglycosylase MltG [Candidatus Sumerlaeota bacterium]
MDQTEKANKQSAGAYGPGGGPATGSSSGGPSLAPARRGCLRVFGCLFQILGIFFLLILLAGLAGLGGFSWWARRDLRQAGAEPSLRVEVKAGESLRSVAQKLEEARVVDRWEPLMALALLRKSERGIQVGEHTFVPGTPPVEILRQLNQAPATQATKVTFPEGWTTRQMAQRLQEKGIIHSSERFLQLCEDAEFLKSVGIPSASAEGYLFPDTYQFSPGLDEAEVIRRLAAQFSEVIHSPKRLGLQPGMNSPNAFPLTFQESVVLASIIQREARLSEEMPLIASVYHNRLRDKKRLESCATVCYLLNKWDAPLTLKDLETDSPYNTYRHEGVPPGAICNPGQDALRAAFQPEKSDYLFYVYKGDGRHEFTRTYAEHEKARLKYKDEWKFSSQQ